MHRKQQVKASSHKQAAAQSLLLEINKAVEDTRALKSEIQTRASDFFYHGKRSDNDEVVDEAIKRVREQLSEINRKILSEKLPLQNQAVGLEIKCLALEIRAAADVGLPLSHLEQVHKDRILGVLKKTQEDWFSCVEDAWCQEELFYIYEHYSCYAKRTSGCLDLVSLLKSLLVKCDDGFVKIRLLGRFMHECVDSSRVKLILSNPDHLNILKSASDSFLKNLKNLNNYSELSLQKKIQLIYASMMNFEYRYLYQYIFCSAKNKIPFKVTSIAAEEGQNLFDSNVPILDEKIPENVLMELLKKDEILVSHYHEVARLLESILIHLPHQNYEFHFLATKIFQHAGSYSDTLAGMYGELLDQFNCGEVKFKLATAKMLFEQAKVWQELSEKCNERAREITNDCYDSFKSICKETDPDARENERYEDEMISSLFHKELVKDFFSQRIYGRLKTIENVSRQVIDRNDIEKKMQVLPEEDRVKAISLLKNKGSRERFLRKYFERLKTEMNKNAIEEFQFGWKKIVALSDKYIDELIKREEALCARRLRIMGKPAKVKAVHEHSPQIEEVLDESSEVEVVVPVNVKSELLQLIESYDKMAIDLGKSIFKNSRDMVSILRIRSKTKKYLPPNLMQIFDDQLKENLKAYRSLISLFNEYQALAASSDEPDIREGVQFSMSELADLIEKSRSQLDEADKLIQYINQKIESEFNQFIHDKGHEVAMQESLLNLSDKDIFSLGWKRFIEMGKAREGQGFSRSNHSLERAYFNTCSREFQRELANFKLQRLDQSSSNVLLPERLPEPDLLIGIANFKIVYPDFISDFFFQYQSLPVYLCGSALSKIILQANGIETGALTDIDFVTSSSNIGDAMTIDNRFRVCQFKPLLCQLKQGDMLFDLYFSDMISSRLPFYDWVRQNSFNRHFTAFSLLSDEHSQVYDLTGRGLSDLLARRLSMVNDPRDVLAEDPACALIAISKILNGFKPDTALLEALYGWSPGGNVNIGYLKVVITKHLFCLSKENRLIYIEWLMQFGLLSKMFGCMAKNANDGLDLLMAVLNMKVGNYQPRLFASRHESNLSSEGVGKHREFKG